MKFTLSILVDQLDGRTLTETDLRELVQGGILQAAPAIAQGFDAGAVRAGSALVGGWNVVRTAKPAAPTGGE